jgi:hypothetical protein
MASIRFCPERALSLCQVSTLCAWSAGENRTGIAAKSTTRTRRRSSLVSMDFSPKPTWPRHQCWKSRQRPRPKDTTIAEPRFATGRLGSRRQLALASGTHKFVPRPVGPAHGDPADRQCRVAGVRQGNLLRRRFLLFWDGSDTELDEGLTWGAARAQPSHAAESIVRGG